MAIPGFVRSLAFLSIALTSVACQAIDNPDAPDYLGDFQSEVATHDQAIYEDAQTMSDSIEAYRDYIGFLEEELTTVISAVESELSGSEREALIKSQSAWEVYQDKEKAFVSSVWTPQTFGTSSAFSRLAFYADVLRSRIELLQKYRMQF